jgi:hypothetical protein
LILPFKFLAFAMRRSIFLCLLTSPFAGAPAALIPTEEGMSWPYHMSQETGEGFGFSVLKPDKEGKIHTSVIYRLAGTQEVDGRTLLKFEMHREGVVTNTDLMTVDQSGINCWARLGLDGNMVKLDRPQTIVAAPLKPGGTWDFNGQAGGTEIHQHYRVMADEEVSVPAGKFRASHIHGEQTAPNPMTIDRWFVTGTGIVKDVTTMRTESGELMRRISLELTARPKLAQRPEVRPPKLLTIGFSKDAVGALSDTFSADTLKICARWQGRGLRKQAKIRAVWIAEDIGDVAPADYTIDEATTEASAPDAHGVFTLARPEDGWAPGIYRVEFYVDGDLAEAAKLKINK